MVAPFLPDEEKFAAIREALPATGAGIYLDTATAGPLPVETQRAMAEWAEWESRGGRVADGADEEYAARLEEAAATLAAVLVAPVERVVLAPSVGSAFRAAAAGRAWRAGERLVVLSGLEPPVRATLVELAAMAGGEMVDVTVAPGAASDDVLSALAEAVEPGAALVAAPHVSPADGSVLSVAEVAALAHGAGAWLAVDGSLAVGAIPVDAPAVGADVYATAGDRWLCGPSGTAAAYLPAGGGRQDHRAAAATVRADLHRAAVVGLGRSVGWLAMQVGLEWAFSRADRLTGSVARSLGAIDGLTLLTPAERPATTLAFRLAGWPAKRLREELSRRAHALVGLVGSDAIRVSIGCWNTDDEVARFAGVVAELAETTPEEAARRRPPLLVMGSERG